MFNLQKRVRDQKTASASGDSPSASPINQTGRISVRDKLLTQEVQDVTSNLPNSCLLAFPDPDCLHKFHLTVSPSTGLWKDGHFVFIIDVPLEYNIMPPRVSSSTKIWHPNIDENGQVCLSLLRTTSLDGTGWAPTRTLKDVIWGLDSLFHDLLNFDDPLNVGAAEHYARNKESFIMKVREYIQLYAK